MGAWLGATLESVHASVRELAVGRQWLEGGTHTSALGPALVHPASLHGCQGLGQSRSAVLCVTLGKRVLLSGPRVLSGKETQGPALEDLAPPQEHTSFWPQGQFPVLTPQGPRTVEPRSSEWGRDISRPHRSWVSPLCEPVFRGSARGCAQCSLAHAGDSMGPCRLSQWPWTTDLSQPSQPEGSTVDWVLSRAILHTAPGDLTVANLVADPPGAACTACVAGCGSPGMRPRPGVLSVGGPVPSSWAITCFSHAALLLVGTADSNQVCEHTLVPPVAIFSGT